MQSHYAICVFTFNEKLFLLTGESLTGLHRTTKGTRYALITDTIHGGLHSLFAWSNLQNTASTFFQLTCNYGVPLLGTLKLTILKFNNRPKKAAFFFENPNFKKCIYFLPFLSFPRTFYFVNLVLDTTAHKTFLKSR